MQDDNDFVDVTLDRDHMIEAGRTSTLLKKGHSYRVPRNHADAIIGAESGLLKSDADKREKKTGDVELVLTSSADIRRSIDTATADQAAYPQQPGNIVGSTAGYEASVERAKAEAAVEQKDEVPKDSDKPVDKLAPIKDVSKPILPAKS